jgi:LacI family transcriptional regulator
VICRLSDPELADFLANAPYPVVDLYGQFRSPRIPFLDTDAKAVAAMAVKFFVNAAFTRFAYCGFPGLWFSDERSDAFIGEVSKFGFEVDVYQPKGTSASADVAAREALHPGGSEELGLWVAGLPSGTAVLACNDVRAQQMLLVAARLGRDVPRDLAVMGVDDDGLICDLTTPRLTSIRPDTHTLGYTAAHWLHVLMEGRTLPCTSLLVPPLHIRERASTDVIACDDLHLTAAVRFIRDHIQSSVDAKRVADHVGRSRSFLEMKFRRHLGRTIKQEIIRARIGRSIVLLHETSLTLQQIAEACGFATATHFSRLFKQLNGRTPGSFRSKAP